MNALELPLTVAVFLAGAFARFYLPPAWNKFFLCACSFALLGSVIPFGTGKFAMLFFCLFVLLVSYSFSWYGGVVSITAVVFIVSDGDGVLDSYQMTGLLLAGVIGTAFCRMSRSKQVSDSVWQKQMYKHSRNLAILKDISIAIQSTMEVGKLLHIILTAITAGYGLGFNRALLFLTDESGTLLTGKVGIGSVNEQEGFVKWNRVVKNKLNLGDYLLLQEEAQTGDNALNDLLRRLDIVLGAQNHVFQRALKEQRPYIIDRIDGGDPVQRMLAGTFRMTSFAVVPMVLKGKPLGVIVVDNNIDREPLAIEEVDNIIPLAAQASIAIENSRLYERTQQLSVTDGLTGLYNQRFLQDTLPRLIRQAERENGDLSVLILDIDFFKRYNDLYGHMEGNNVLIGVGEIIRESVSKTHVPCRFGGEEFVVLLPRTPQEEAVDIAESIRSSMERHPFPHASEQPGGKLTVSVGVASFRPGMDSERLQSLADSALYEAKRNGKNRVVAYAEGGGER